MQEKKLESNPAIIYDFSILDQQRHCLSGEVTQDRSVKGGSRHRRIRAVCKPLRDMLLGLAVWPKFADKRSKVAVARAVEEARAVSGVYV